MSFQAGAAKTLSSTQWNARATKARITTEKSLGIYNNAVAQDRRIAHENNWERKTDAILEKNQIKLIASNIEAGQKQSLLERRERLANMLAREDEQYRIELAGLQENSHDRAKRLVAKARELKKDREAKRQEYAQSQYNRQWRESSDDLRTIEGEKFADHCYKEIANQRQDRMYQREQERQNENQWAGVWAADKQAKDALAEQKIRDRKQYNHENKLQLLAQMTEQRYRREADWLVAERERGAFRRQLAEDERDTNNRKAEKQEQKEMLQSELVAFNNELQQSRLAALRQKKKEEHDELEWMMNEYRKELEQRRIGQDKMIHEMKQYRAYLAERKAEDKLIEENMEKLVMEEMERAQLKRDAQWLREKLAREQLMKDVFDGRQQQVRDKQEKRLIFEHEFSQERNAIEREIQKARDLEDQEAAEARLKAMDQQRNLLRQIDQNNARKLVDEQRVVAEKNKAEEMERQYQAFIQRERNAARSSPSPNHGRRQVEM